MNLASWPRGRPSLTLGLQVWQKFQEVGVVGIKVAKQRLWGETTRRVYPRCPVSVKPVHFPWASECEFVLPWRQGKRPSGQASGGRQALSSEGRHMLWCIKNCKNHPNETRRRRATPVLSAKSSSSQPMDRDPLPAYISDIYVTTHHSSKVYKGAMKWFYGWGQYSIDCIEGSKG